jgi:hypothetical protein
MTGGLPGVGLANEYGTLGAAGVMLRIDPGVEPSMAKAPTLAEWELELLRTVERVVRMGRVREVHRAEIVLDAGRVALDPGALVVHCAASGLHHPPLVQIWGPELIRLQTIRAGFPCFAAALAGYVEATRDDDRERNRLCPPNVYGNSLAEWVLMQVRSSRAAAAFGAESDIVAWTNTCALNPARVEPKDRDNPRLRAASARVSANSHSGLTRMAELAEQALGGAT